MHTVYRTVVEKKNDREKKRKNSIVFVAEGIGQMSSSDCCGGLPSTTTLPGTVDEFCHQREKLTAMSKVFMELSQMDSEGVSVERVDPRSLWVAWIIVLRDAIIHRAGIGAIVRALLMWYPVPSLFVNGRCVAARNWPDSDELVKTVQRRIGVMEISTPM